MTNEEYNAVMDEFEPLHEAYINSVIVKSRKAHPDTGELYFSVKRVTAVLSGLLMRTCTALYDARANGFPKPSDMQPADVQAIADLIEGLADVVRIQAMAAVINGLTVSAQLDTQGNAVPVTEDSLP